MRRSGGEGAAARRVLCEPFEPFGERGSRTRDDG
jgi:hypothetical protein